MMLVRREHAKARLWSECRGSGSWGAAFLCRRFSISSAPAAHASLAFPASGLSRFWPFPLLASRSNFWLELNLNLDFALNLSLRVIEVAHTL
jgi:hypothetical protein